jgi:hypothetical protein
LIRRTALIAALAAALLQPQSAMAAEAKELAVQAYPLPAGKPVSIVIMRPDVEVGEAQSGGGTRANADWTQAARQNLAKALRAELISRHMNYTIMDNEVQVYRTRMEAMTRAVACQGSQSPTAGPPPVPALPTCTEAMAPQVIDVEPQVAVSTALHRAVVEAILSHQYQQGYGALVTRRGSFAFTLGSGTGQLGEISGANYGLFVFSQDQFAGDARGDAPERGRMGCILGLCAEAHGHHAAYVSLVELDTGNVVWFNLRRGSKDDVRAEAGARELVRDLLAGMPTRPGEMMAPPVKRRIRL